MDQPLALWIVVGAAIIGLVATILILARQRRAAEDEERESPFATSTEGMLRCPSCGTGNLVTDSTCSSCGRALPT
jgi:hypothetical protein